MVKLFAWFGCWFGGGHQFMREKTSSEVGYKLALRCQKCNYLTPGWVIEKRGV